MPPKSALSPLEQDVMNAVWSHEKTTVADVQTALMPQRPLKESTVRTLLTRLEEKGYLQHEADGRAFAYSATEPPRTLAVRAVKQIVDRFCQGSLESLLVGMVDNAIVDPNELQGIVDRLTARRSLEQRKVPKRKGHSK
jgi:BlaI family transcriptional regulator, penicillinase repressor